MGRGPGEAFFQRTYADGQQAHGKILRISNRKGNANQNPNEISLPTCQNGYRQKDNKQKVLIRTWEKETLMHYWWGCKLVRPLWKIVWVFLTKLKTELLYDPTIPLLGIFLKKMKTLIHKCKCTPIFTATLFTTATIRMEAN